MEHYSVPSSTTEASGVHRLSPTVESTEVDPLLPDRCYSDEQLQNSEDDGSYDLCRDLGSSHGEVREFSIDGLERVGGDMDGKVLHFILSQWPVMIFCTFARGKVKQEILVGNRSFRQDEHGEQRNFCKSYF